MSCYYFTYVSRNESKTVGSANVTRSISSHFKSQIQVGFPFWLLWVKVSFLLIHDGMWVIFINEYFTLSLELWLWQPCHLVCCLSWPWPKLPQPSSKQASLRERNLAARSAAPTVPPPAQHRACEPSYRIIGPMLCRGTPRHSRHLCTNIITSS
jgi:hypothetical protein